MSREGKIYKLSPQTLFGVKWDERTLRLQNSTLYYYAKETLKGEVPTQDATVTLLTQDDYPGEKKKETDPTCAHV